jgi:hypothetical protein
MRYVGKCVTARVHNDDIMQRRKDEICMPDDEDKNTGTHSYFILIAA